MQSKKECLSIKLMAEQEAVLFHQQLGVLRQALAGAQAANTRMRKQQDNQVSEHQNPSSSLPLSSLCKADCGPGSSTLPPAAVTGTPQLRPSRRHCQRKMAQTSASLLHPF